MIAVLFEVVPKANRVSAYFELAESLSSSLSKIEGFISIERFQSLSETAKYLSLSWWENEAAIEQWKANLAHQAAQTKGKEELFSYFRIRVAQVVRDYDFSYSNQS